MKPALFDTHAHFSTDAASVAAQLQAAANAGVRRIVAVGGSPQLNAGALLAASLGPGQVSLALGLDRDQAVAGVNPAALDACLDAATAAGLCAIGETGLDYHYHPETASRQRALFEAHLAAAARRQVPVIVHTREADDDTLALLRNVAPVLPSERCPGVIHCFTGGWPFAEQLLQLGYCLSFSGIVTFANAASLREVAARVPDDRLLIETDSPYLTPVPLRGRPNEPAHVSLVAACLAKVRGVSLDALAALTTANAERLLAART